MANTSLIQSNWSNISNIKCGYLLFSKPKKVKLKSFDPNINSLEEDSFVINVDGNLYCLFNNEDMFNIAKYTVATDTWAIIHAGAEPYQYDFSAVGFNNKIYIFGDSLGNLTFRIYDIVGNAWSDGTIDNNFLFNYWSTDITYHNTDIYIFGKKKGVDDYNVNPFFVKFDTLTNTWSAIDFTDKVIDTSCPGNYSFCNLGKTTDGFYLIGEGKNTFWKYVYTTNTWEIKDSNHGLDLVNLTETSPFFESLFHIEDKVIGTVLRIEEEKEYYQFKVYDIATNTWSQLANIPGVEEYNPKLFSFINNDLCLLSASFNKINPVEIIDIDTTLSNDGKIKQPSYSFVYDGKLYSLIFNNQLVIQCIDLVSKEITLFELDKFNYSTDSSWIMEVAKTHKDNILYLYGGRDINNNAKNTLYKVDVVAKTIVEENSTGEARWGSTGYYFNDKIYIVGGCSVNSDTYFDTVQVYDTVAKTWASITPSDTNASRRYYPQVIIKDDSIYIYGGESDSVLESERQKVYKVLLSDGTTTALTTLPSIGGYSLGRFFLFDDVIYYTGYSMNTTTNFQFHIFDPVANTCTLDKTITMNSLVITDITISSIFIYDSKVHLYGSADAPVYIENCISGQQIFSMDFTGSTYTMVIGNKEIYFTIFYLSRPSIDYLITEEETFYAYLYWKANEVDDFTELTILETSFYYDDNFSFSLVKPYPNGLTLVEGTTYYFQVKIGTKKTNYSELSQPFSYTHTIS